MKINIDLRAAFITGGISNFKRNLSKLLSECQDVDAVGCYNWSRNATRDRYAWYPSLLKRSIIPEQFVYKQLSRRGLELPISYEMMMNSFADLNLFLTFDLPSVKFKAPVISTIHDIILLKTDAEEQSVKDEYENTIRNTIRKSQRILTVSQAAKSDLIEYFGIDPSKINIVHNGINHSQFTEELDNTRREELQRKYNLPEQFILYFGGYRAHKNIERLLEAYALLPQNIRRELKLVITNRNPKLISLAAKLRIEDDVVFTQYVDESDKCAMYKSATMVYYASLYEGFGVPVIESQICNTPVITSVTSSLPEASGGFAEHINPYSVDEIYQAILYLYSDNQRRNYLISNGYNNALKYTWERGTEELYDAISYLGK